MRDRGLLGMGINGRLMLLLLLLLMHACMSGMYMCVPVYVTVLRKATHAVEVVIRGGPNLSILHYYNHYLHYLYLYLYDWQ
jgi:hypothetical protein